MLHHIAAICASSRSRDLCEQVIMRRGGMAAFAKKKAKPHPSRVLTGKKRLFADKADLPIRAAKEKRKEKKKKKRR